MFTGLSRTEERPHSSGCRLQRRDEERRTINVGTSITHSISMEHVCMYVTRCDGPHSISLSTGDLLQGGKESVNDMRLKI